MSAAPYGSASILPISWMYIAMMGGDGLKAASEVAILNANYVARRLAPHYPVLYTGPGGLVAHECILDLRALKETLGHLRRRRGQAPDGLRLPRADDVVPGPGTLMVEPTESESKAELDRFCDAMIAIREEIRAVEEGRLDREDNPLKHAPHTAAAVLADDWKHAYPRELAAFPVKSLRDASTGRPSGAPTTSTATAPLLQLRAGDRRRLGPRFVLAEELGDEFHRRGREPGEPAAGAHDAATVGSVDADTWRTSRSTITGLRPGVRCGSPR